MKASLILALISSLVSVAAHAQVQFRNSKLTVTCASIDRVKWGSENAKANEEKRQACNALADAYQQKWMNLVNTMPVFADDTMIVTASSSLDRLNIKETIKIEFVLRSDTHVISNSSKDEFQSTYRNEEEIKTDTVCSNANRVLAADPTVFRFETSKGTRGGILKPKTVCNVSNLIKIQAVDLK